MKKYTIGEVAKITGVPTKTLRFYEEKEIIKAAMREDNGYRLFDEENIEEIKLIKYARDLGLPLVEIKKLTRGCTDGNCEHTKETNKKIIDGYIAALTERITQMQNLKERMVRLQKRGPYCCEILHQLVINDRKEGEK
ncbi:MAG TPA: MerR family transcriptional regulator [Spirochaetia bacterium]|nr:MerR family transcriptional regulator [Spirochaetia bacterium]